MSAYGRVATQSTPYQGAEQPYYTTTTYDILGRPLAVMAPDSTVTSFAYDGLVTTSTDAENNETMTVLDDWGRTASVTPETEIEQGVAYAYDELDQVLTTIRGGLETRLTYDNAGRKLTMSDPDMGDWSYTYDALGNLKTQTDSQSCVLTLGYDNLNRLTSKVSSGTCGTPVDVSYWYDEGANGKGHRTSMSDGSGSFGEPARSSTWSYDERGRRTSETKAISGGGTFTTEWVYNSADLPTSLTYPDDEVLDYAYDERMLLIGLVGDATYVQAGEHDFRRQVNESWAWQRKDD